MFDGAAVEALGNVQECDRVRRGGRVEVRPLDATRDEIELVCSARSLDRPEQGRGETLRQAAPARRDLVVLDHACELHRIAQAAQRPEVVPVGMHRLCQVTFVADGNRQQPVRLTQSFNAGNGFDDEGPGLLEEPGIRRKPVAVGDGGDQLTVAVVFHEPIGSVAVHAARDETVRALVGRIPTEELQRFLPVRHAQ